MSSFSIVSKNSFEEIVILEIRENEDLLETIHSFVKKNDVAGGVILGGVGALKKATYRNAKYFPPALPFKEEQLHVETVENPLELLNLSGWIGRGDKKEVVIHSHIMCSYYAGNKVNTVGGHLMPGTLSWLLVTVQLGILKEKMEPKYDQDKKLWIFD